jgi:galactose mutarotase-like enzyme
MYAAILMRRLAELRLKTWRAVVQRSGLFTVLGIGLLLIVAALGWRAHVRGRFARLKADMKKPTNVMVSTPRPGGQDVVVLERTQIEGGTVPEFLTATLLPGRGLDVLQITAYLPKKGEVKLLASPSLEDAVAMMTDTGADANGAASLETGGPFEAPWAGKISGAVSHDGKNIATSWRGESMNLPVSWHRNGIGNLTGGFLLKLPSTTITTNVMPDGGEVQAVFNAEDFDGHWPSKTQISAMVQLNSRAIEMKLVARNTGEEPEPMGLGWRPRFAILSADRAGARIRIPSNQRAEMKDPKTGHPSGSLITANDESEYDFTARNGAKLGSLSLDDTFVHLRQTLMDSGPIAEFIDPTSGYGLRITALNPNIKAMHVYAPADKDFVSIAPRFNYDDPFGHEWANDEDKGMVVLAPGQSVEWRIRLEIFALGQTEASHL